MTEAERQDTRKAAEKADAREALTLEMLVREHASAVLRPYMAHVKNFHDGEDIMQDVFLKAFTRIDTSSNATRARRWLLKIAGGCVMWKWWRISTFFILKRPAQLLCY